MPALPFRPHPYVKVNDNIIVKPSFDVTDDDNIDVDVGSVRYVARSAHKLITAIEKFSLEFKDKVAVDIGSSTGGFCQVMLQNDVRLVYAVDVGTDQLHSQLRCDNRVVVRENTNARYIRPSDFDDEIDIVTCDISFISVKYILNPVFDLLKDNGEFVCLVKPQFEVGPKYVSKNGVVKDVSAQASAVKEVINYSINIGFSVYDVCFSGLEGESGNREFLLYLKKDDCGFKIKSQYIDDVVFGRLI